MITQTIGVCTVFLLSLGIYFGANKITRFYTNIDEVILVADSVLKVLAIAFLFDGV